MLGADVGTAVVTQILSLDLNWLAPMLVLAGYLVWKLDNARWHNVGYLLFGLGLVLIALTTMKGISTEMESSPLLEALLTSLRTQVFMTLLVAAVITWLIVHEEWVGWGARTSTAPFFSRTSKVSTVSP